MRLRASVRRLTGATRHVVHGADVAPQIAWVEIEPADGAYLLLYFDGNGDGLADTWHETVEDAQAQAQFEFEIDPSEWTPVSPDGAA